MLTNGAWTIVDGLVHGFLNRRECATGSPWHTTTRPLWGALPVVVPRQVHGTTVVSVGRDPTERAADAIVTATPGILAAIVTADCVPVLLVAPESRVAAAVHAGWRGAAAGVVEATIARLDRDGGVAPSAISATIGPAIGPCCYPVGHEVFAAFRRRTGATTASAWSTRRDGVAVIDLRHAVALLLRHAGVRDVQTVGPCTACDPEYGSFRRSGTDAGRQLSVIGWRPTGSR